MREADLPPALRPGLGKVKSKSVKRTGKFNHIGFQAICEEEEVLEENYL
jgi:hypothetical protein